MTVHSDQIMESNSLFRTSIGTWLPHKSNEQPIFESNSWLKSGSKGTQGDSLVVFSPMSEVVFLKPGLYHFRE
jgi:hypothetical protein